MTEAYRTLLMRYDLKSVPERLRFKLIEIIRHTEALNVLLARGYNAWSPCVPRKWYHDQLYFIGRSWMKDVPKRWRLDVHPVLNVQIRTNSERDRGCPIFIDLQNNIVKVRGFGDRTTVILPLKESYERYIRDRLREGAKARACMIWTDGKYVFLGLVFAKQHECYEPRMDVVVDVNTILHGVTVGWLENGRIVVKRLPENLGEVLTRLYKIYGEAVRVERKMGFHKRMGHHSDAKRLRRQASSLRRRFNLIIRDAANKVVHEVVRLALQRRARLIIDTPYFESLEELSQQYHGVFSLLMKSFSRRVERMLINQCQWYGIPYELRRLPSTKCPRCEGELRGTEDRVMVCDRCGLREDRDVIPILSYVANNLMSCDHDWLKRQVAFEHSLP